MKTADFVVVGCSSWFATCMFVYKYIRIYGSFPVWIGAVVLSRRCGIGGFSCFTLDVVLPEDPERPNALLPKLRRCRQLQNSENRWLRNIKSHSETFIRGNRLGHKNIGLKHRQRVHRR